MKKIFTIFTIVALFATQVLSQCVANDFASLQSCFSQSGTVNITLSADITLTGDLVMSNATTYNITLGSFDIIRNGQSYTGGDVNTKIVVGAATIVNTTGGLTITGLNNTTSLRSYVVLLPVELLYFTATTKKNIVELAFETALETNASHFEIERSVDAKNWSRIATIKAANKPTRYIVIDDTPLSIGAYYRLKQVDIDGKFEIFKNVFVEKKDSKLIIFPNPTMSQVTIVSQEPIAIYDQVGRLYQSAKEGNVTISNLPKGIWLVRAGSETQRVIVQ